MDLPSPSSSEIEDKEQFTLDDNIARRIIYPLAQRTYDDAVSVTMFNITAEHFEPGAAKWSDMKEPMASVVYKAFNLGAHFVGNKDVAKILPPSLKRVKQNNGDAINPNDENYNNACAVVENYGKLQKSDRIGLDIETLFSENTEREVVGLRLVFVSKITKLAPLDINNDQHQQQQQVPDRIPVDMLALAFNHCAKEEAEIKKTYEAQCKVYTMELNKTKKTPERMAKSATDTELYKLYNFILYGSTIQECFIQLVRASLISDESRSVDRDEGYPNFVDNRDIMSPRSIICEQGAGSREARESFIKNSFSMQAAMMYHVRTANVCKEQRDLNNYIKKESFYRYDVHKTHDVKDLDNMCISDSSFHCYPNPRTTYRIENEHISPEFISKMPLPHRIGTILPLLPTMVSEPVSHVQTRRVSLQVEEEDDDDVDNDDIVVEGEEMAQTMTIDENYLDENDLDGTMAQKIFDRPACYGYREEEAQKPLGLHDVYYTVTAKDVLACKKAQKGGVANAKNADDICEIDEQFKKKFLSDRRERVTVQINSTANNLSRPCNMVKFLAKDHDDHRENLKGVRHGTLTTNNNNDQKVYKSLTQSFVIKIATHKDTNNDPNVIDDSDNNNEEESTDNLSQDERDEDTNERRRVDLVDNYRKNNNDFLEGFVEDANEEGEAVKPVAAAATTTTTTTAKTRFFSNKNLEDNVPFREQSSRKNKNPNFRIEWESFIANAVMDVCLPILELRRSKGNTMDDIRKSADLIRDEDWLLERDIFLRLCALNKKAFRNLDSEYFDANGTIPDELYAKYRSEKNRLIAAMTIEVWNEFFTSEHVSKAVEGVREDWNKATSTIADGKKQIVHSHNKRVYRLDVRPYHQYKIWCYDLFATILLIHYNFKLMFTNYIFKFHHCRWYVKGDTNPKLNALCHGDNMGGKSYIIAGVKFTCPTGVGDNLTSMTDNAFNVDRNLNDMLILVDEMQNKYLGISAGGKGGNSAPTEGDALNFLKNRLTRGVTEVLHYFNDEETGKRDCKHAKSSCQGNHLCATNAKLADADKHLLSRFTLLSVPKSFGDTTNSKQPSKRVDQFALDPRQGDILYEEHKDVHRLYLFVEKCIMSNVLNNQAYGVSINGANIFIHDILDKMQRDFNIPTNHSRKRNSVLEMARCMCISFAVWNALTSPVLHYLQYDPITLDYIGINPRLVIQGIFPFLIITKDMVIDSLTSLSTVWQHDQLKNVLEGIIRNTNLLSPCDGKFKIVPESEADTVVLEYDKQNKVKRTGGGKSAAAKAAAKSNQQPTAGGHNQSFRGGSNNTRFPAAMVPTITDFNYVCLEEKTFDAIYKGIARQLGVLQVSANAIEQILKDASEEQSDIALPSYTYEKGSTKPSRATNTGGGEMDEDDETNSYGSLVLDSTNTTVSKRKLVTIDRNPLNGNARVCVLISYLKELLPNVLEDAIVQDLKTFQLLRNKQQDDEDFGVVPDDNDNNEQEKSRADEDDDSSTENRRASKDDDMLGGNTEKDDTFLTLIRKLRRAGHYNSQSDAPMIMTTKKVYENSIHEKTNDNENIRKAKEKEYKTVYSGYIPWLQYPTSDAPDPIRTSDVFSSIPKEIKHSKEFVREICFNDTTKVLLLERKGNARVTIPNYAYVSPSAKASLSIYDPLIVGNDVIKATSRIYNSASSMLLREDIDFMFAKAHLAHIAYEPIDTSDERFLVINYPPNLCQIHTDYSRTQLEIQKTKAAADREVRRLQNLEKQDVLDKLIKEADEELLSSIFSEYPLCNMLSRVNHQGDIMNNKLNGEQSNCENMDEMLMANSNRMKQEFVLQNTAANRNVIRCKKRLEYNDEKSQEIVRTQIHDILKKRLVVQKNNTNTVATTLNNRKRLRENESVKLYNKNTIATTTSASLESLSKNIEKGKLACGMMI